MITVSLLYSPGEDLPLIERQVHVEEGSTVADVLIKALYEQHPETKDYPVGIFSKIVPLTQRLENGNRLEVYRPLRLNPKDARRARAIQKRV